MEEQRAGQWFRSRTRFGPLFHAHLFAGQENSGKLVTLVKQQARLLALDTGAALLLVVEPTISGVHDYACAYCQLGRTIRMQVERQPFYEPEQVVRAVREQVEKAGRAGVRVDYLTFVPDGEPTLDANLDGFAFTGDVEEDLLSITAVHPMREEAVGKLLARSQADWSTVRRLVAQGRLVQVEYGGRVFYLRKLGR